jgi:hypothetical protein
MNCKELRILNRLRPPQQILGWVWERCRSSVSENGCSAKATEAEAGQRPFSRHS